MIATLSLYTDLVRYNVKHCIIINLYGHTGVRQHISKSYSGFPTNWRMKTCTLQDHVIIMWSLNQFTCTLSWINPATMKARPANSIPTTILCSGLSKISWGHFTNSSLYKFVLSQQMQLCQYWIDDNFKQRNEHQSKDRIKSLHLIRLDVNTTTLKYISQLE